MTKLQTKSSTDHVESSRAASVKGAAATAFPQATEAAISLLQQDGNAIDAAVAAAWTLAVCEPSASGLGGQSTLLIYGADGQTRVIDGHSYAPADVSTASVSEREQRLGHRACVIPSTPATLAYAQRRYGLLPVATGLAPAIQVAQDGYAITPLQNRQAGWFERQMRVSESIAKLFLVDGMSPPIGYVSRQPELARTLRRMADAGIEDFYSGQIARAIVADMRRHGGLLNEDDLANFSLPVERDPLEIHYRGMLVLSAPAPGGGLNLLFALKVMERLLPNRIDNCDGDSWYEAIALASYCTFRERELRDARRVGQDGAVPNEYLSEEHVDQATLRLMRERSLPLVTCSEGPGDTTHLTVADAAGNVVALTQSIQSVFGAKVANPQLGFVYNNYLCACPTYAHPNQLEPGCVPQSNAAPTIVMRETESGAALVLALGAAGSRRITSSLLQVISQVVDRGLPIDQAVAAPRLHGLLSGKVWIEEPIASPEFVARLQQRFKEVIVKKPLNFGMGCVQGLQWGNDGRIMGAADPRRDGTEKSCEGN